MKKKTAEEITGMSIYVLAQITSAEIVIRDGEKKIAVDLSDVEDAARQTVIDRKSELIAYLESKVEEEKAKEEAEFICYVVNHPYCLSDNGFDEYDPAIIKILADTIPKEFNDLEIQRDILWAAYDDDTIRAMALPYYTADEHYAYCYGNNYAQRVANHEACGNCMVPREIATQMIEKAINIVLRREAQKRISALEDELNYMRGHIVASREEGRVKARAYNNLYNEGAEGYVPCYYLQEDIDAAENRLKKWRKYDN